MQPTIIQKKFQLVGVITDIDLSTDFTEKLENLRTTLKQNLKNIQHVISPVRMVGLWLPDTSQTGDENTPKRFYFAGVEVARTDSVPGNLVIKELPESVFAVFREKTRGTIASYAYNVWLPNSGYQYNMELMGDLEIYDDMDACGVNDECDILIPIMALQVA